MRRHRIALTCGVAVLTLALAGCGSDPEDVELGGEVAPSADDPADPDPTESTEGDTGDATADDEALPGGGASPAPGSCVDVPQAEDGVYTVADAGTVTLTFADGVLTLGRVEPAAGWEHEVTESEPDEIEVELRDGATEVDLEAQVDDGTLTVEICSDDD